MKCFSEYLREAGYYCSNNAKTDYNFAVPKDAWDECSRKAHWRNRQPGQPFFAVFNHEVCHESQIRVPEAQYQQNTARLTPAQRHDPAKAPVPPFHPDTPEVRRDWARYYDNITAMDYQIGDKLKELEDAGLAEDTIVFFFGDNGTGLPGHEEVDLGRRPPRAAADPFPEEMAAPRPRRARPDHRPAGQLRGLRADGAEPLRRETPAASAGRGVSRRSKPASRANTSTPFATGWPSGSTACASCATGASSITATSCRT